MHTNSPSTALLSVRNLRKYYLRKAIGFSKPREMVRAVERVNLEIKNGEVFGLVGESGCGKSTLGRTVLMYEPLSDGEIYFKEQRIDHLRGQQLKEYRRRAQMIYQDPYSSLNPRTKIGTLIEEPLVIHRVGTPKERRERVLWLLDKVGLVPEHADRYPHEFSGGQRQRIVIARALALNPELIVADEPISALDVSIQAQVINLMEDLGHEFGLTYLFISHDLSVVEYICHRLAVMYLGSFVEQAPKEAFFRRPFHPYSKALLDAAPIPDPHANRSKMILQGDVPSPIRPPSGCTFHPRCPYCRERCRQEKPVLLSIADDRWVACHFPLL